MYLPFLVLLAAVTCIYSGNKGSGTKCDGKPLKNGGFQIMHGTNNGKLLYYYCDQNYELVGDPVQSCLGDESLGNEMPTCKRLYRGKRKERCQAKPLKNGGYEVLHGTKGNTILNYYCDSGYKLVGDPLQPCSNLEDWGSEMPTCKHPLEQKSKGKKRCHAKTLRNGGYEVLHGTKGNTIINYYCDSGYELVGDPVQPCSNLEDWGGEMPTCKHPLEQKRKERCQAKPLKNGGYEVLHGSKGNTILNYYCDSGYELVGDPVQPCSNLEDWGSEMPTCKHPLEQKSKRKERCQAKPLRNGGYEVLHGTKGNTILNYYCDSGYELVGDPVQPCFNLEDWGSEMPTCKHPLEQKRQERCQGESIEHGGYEVLHGTMGNTILYYYCDSGYDLVGDPVQPCSNVKESSSKMPTCKNRYKRPKKCQGESLENGGYEVLHGTKGNTILYYYCDSDYELVGDPVQPCSDGERLSNKMPTCKHRYEKQNYPELNREADSDYYINRLFEDDSEADSDYYINRLFEDDSASEYDQTTPDKHRQEELTHSELNIEDDNDYYINRLFEDDSVSEYDQTTPDKHRQEEKECEVTKLPNGYARIFTDVNMDRAIYYHCKPGYFLIGEAIQTCLPSGVWNGVVPICKRQRRSEQSSHALKTFQNNVIMYAISCPIIQSL